MKLLLDGCVEKTVAPRLHLLGHDVLYVGDFPADPGDETLMRLAYRDGRVIVTHDKDFGTLAVLFRLLHRGIIRLVDIPTAMQAEFVDDVIGRYAREIDESFIITCERSRVRLRAPEPGYIAGDER